MLELHVNSGVKNIIITGATSGIGYGVCESTLAEGSRVFALGRNEKGIESLIDRFGESNIIFQKVDLSDIDDIENLIKLFCNQYGKIDGLVHCAGIEETVPLRLYSPQKIKTLFDVNVFSGIELLRVCSKKNISNDLSSFVFLSSVMGVLGQTGKVGYCASKSAVLGMVKAAALELAKRKIRVNAVLPGIVNTPMTEKLFSELSKENVKQIEDMHPLGLGEIKDIVPIILFLISEKSRWFTGQSFIVDGGYSIQ